MKHDISDLRDLEKIAHKFSNSILTTSVVLYLNGDLGAGKTTFVQRILANLGYSGKVKSPTYTYVESYQINSVTLHHFDLYRITDPAELEFLGLDDYISEDATLIFEWPSLGAGQIPLADVQVRIDMIEESRLMSIESCSEKGIEFLQ